MLLREGQLGFGAPEQAGAGRHGKVSLGLNQFQD
jgi:hypothetical protein